MYLRVGGLLAPATSEANRLLTDSAHIGGLLAPAGNPQHPAFVLGGLLAETGGMLAFPPLIPGGALADSTSKSPTFFY